MRMLCRVEMPNNEQTFGRFWRWRLLRGSGFVTGAVLVALPLLLAAFTAWLWLAGAGALFGAALTALSGAYSVYALYIRPGAVFRTKPGAALESWVYVFTDTGLVRSVRSEEGGAQLNESLGYTSLVRAVETKRDFYLFTSPQQAWLVDKDYFTKGEPAQLRAALQTALGARFKC